MYECRYMYTHIYILRSSALSFSALYVFCSSDFNCNDLKTHQRTCKMQIQAGTCSHELRTIVIHSALNGYLHIRVCAYVHVCA